MELPVPVQKRGEIVHASRQHQEESKKSTQGKQTLATLEVREGPKRRGTIPVLIYFLSVCVCVYMCLKENLRAVVNTLEQMEEQTASLDHECSKLRQQLEENEAAQEVHTRTQTHIHRCTDRHITSSHNVFSEMKKHLFCYLRYCCLKEKP